MGLSYWVGCGIYQLCAPVRPLDPSHQLSDTLYLCSAIEVLHYCSFSAPFPACVSWPCQREAGLSVVCAR